MINTLFCDSRIKPASYITICVVAKEHLFSRNSEAEASEIKNNVEKLLLYSGSWSWLYGYQIVYKLLIYG